MEILNTAVIISFHLNIILHCGGIIEAALIVLNSWIHNRVGDHQKHCNEELLLWIRKMYFTCLIIIDESQCQRNHGINIQMNKINGQLKCINSEWSIWIALTENYLIYWKTDNGQSQSLINENTKSINCMEKFKAPLPSCLE